MVVHYPRGVSTEPTASGRSPSETTARASLTRVHRLTTTERGLESLSLGAATVALLVVAALAVPVFRLASAPIAGDGSVGQFSAIAAAAVAPITFIGARFVRPEHRRPGGLHILDWLDLFALALAHAVIALLTWTLLADILGRGFIGAEVYPLAVLVLAGSVSGVTAYLVFFSATHMDLLMLAVVLAVFMAEGIIASMLAASDPEWWRNNLSALGMTSNVSAMAFNLTLIAGGVLVTTLARYVTVNIPTSNPRGLRWVRGSIVAIGVLLAFVGVFPVDRFWFLHTASAAGMALAFGLLAVMLRRWIPEMPRPLAAAGWLFFGAMVVLGVLYAIGYYTLTAVELVAGVLLFAWIIMLIRTSAALAADATAGADTV
jgi:hypothetical membrane protein